MNKYDGPHPWGNAVLYRHHLLAFVEICYKAELKAQADLADQFCEVLSGFYTNFDPLRFKSAVKRRHNGLPLQVNRAKNLNKRASGPTQGNRQNDSTDV